MLVVLNLKMNMKLTGRGLNGWWTKLWFASLGLRKYVINYLAETAPKMSNYLWILPSSHSLHLNQAGLNTC